MASHPTAPGIHHINLGCRNLVTSKKINRDITGFSVAPENDSLFAFAVGAVFIVFKLADATTKFNPFTVGADVAIAGETEKERNRVAKELSHAHAENTGVKSGPTLQREYLAFKDPVGIQWEFDMI
jgi:catechol 2,3-dioxygenase-like lactoylglutathione lyase family enzyme